MRKKDEEEGREREGEFTWSTMWPVRCSTSAEPRSESSHLKQVGFNTPRLRCMQMQAAFSLTEVATYWFGQSCWFVWHTAISCWRQLACNCLQYRL